MERALAAKLLDMEILDLLPFVRDNYGNIGIADQGTFAARMWRLSDEAFNSIDGTKFSWIAPNGGSYVDHRDNFSRPTAEQVIAGITPAVKEKALEQGLIAL